MSSRVVIVGAGVIGLAAALDLAEAGFAVTVVERGRAMEESSWAAAGMLAVEDPENPTALRALSAWSRALYPEFLERIERLSGLRVPLRTARTLQGVLGSEKRATLPGLRTDRYGFRELAEASLDPRDLCAALPRAARAAGIELREGATVASLKSGVELASGERLAAEHVVLAAGAWTGLVRLPGELRLPVVPRKGQMIEVTLATPVLNRPALNRPALPVVVRTPELYLVPRGDGRVAVGATVEDAGFDRAVDRDAGDRLWHAAGELWPPILRGRITARWTGLRPGFGPGSADALPAIGALGPGAWVAAGHFRNGILLAPGTARALRCLVLGEPLPVALEPFRPGRFEAAAVLAR